MDRRLSLPKPMKQVFVLLIVLLQPIKRAEAIEAKYLQVESPLTYIYEEPHKDSAIIRRLFLGEVIQPVENVTSDLGYKWVKVRIADSQHGYIPFEKFVKALPLPNVSWAPDRIIRHDLPLSFAMQSGGELFGPGLDIRHMALTRIGLSLGVGSILDYGEMRGTSLAAGLVVIPALGAFTPILELGFTRLSYHDSNSTLRISCFYLTLGLEWMFDSGVYLNGGVTYVRSTDVELTYEIEEGLNGEREVGDYGRFNVVKENPSYQTINPLMTLGYAF